MSAPDAETSAREWFFENDPEHDDFNYGKYTERAWLAGYRARDGEVERLREELDRLRATFGHYHVTCRNGVRSDGEECLECGLNVRDSVHSTANERVARYNRNERHGRLAALPLSEPAP